MRAGYRKYTAAQDEERETQEDGGRERERVGENVSEEGVATRKEDRARNARTHAHTNI
mgnify:FL=1